MKLYISPIRETVHSVTKRESWCKDRRMSISKIKTNRYIFLNLKLKLNSFHQHFDIMITVFDVRKKYIYEMWKHNTHVFHNMWYVWCGIHKFVSVQLQMKAWYIILRRLFFVSLIYHPIKLINQGKLYVTSVLYLASVSFGFAVIKIQMHMNNGSLKWK